MLYSSLKVKNLNFKNRSVMAPMCMYMSDLSGVVKDFHVIHYATRAMGGVGLIIQEATAIDPNGRISLEDLGIWDDMHVEGLKRIVDQIHEHGSLAGIQINHAGRKARTKYTIAPSAISFSESYKLPNEMTVDDIKEIVDQFRQAARRAHEAGYDLLEIHAAHGYLLCQFLSPNTNHRKDSYKDRKKLLKEVVEAVRKEWPKEKALAIRFSAYEYSDIGITPSWLSKLINELKPFEVDIIDVSSGGNIATQDIKIYPGYQLGFAKEIKEMTNLIVIGGGLIDNVKLADFAISNESCDLVYFGRLLLRDPYHLINHASDLGFDIEYPKPYIRGKR